VAGAKFRRRGKVNATIAAAVIGKEQHGFRQAAGDLGVDRTTIQRDLKIAATGLALRLFWSGRGQRRQRTTGAPALV